MCGVDAYCAPGLPSPTTSQSTGGERTPVVAGRYSALLVARVGGRLAGLGLGAVLAHELGLLLEALLGGLLGLGVDRGDDERGDDDLAVVDQGHALGRRTADRCIGRRRSRAR